MMIKDFFVKLINRELSPESSIVVTDSEIIKCVKISEIQTAVVIQVSLKCGIIKVMTNMEIHIHYQLKTNDDITSNLVP